VRNETASASISEERQMWDELNQRIHAFWLANTPFRNNHPLSPLFYPHQSTRGLLFIGHNPSFADEGYSGFYEQVLRHTGYLEWPRGHPLGSTSAQDKPGIRAWHTWAHCKDERCVTVGACRGLRGHLTGD